MGTFNYTFSFGPKDGSALEEVEGLVDTGSACRACLRNQEVGWGVDCGQAWWGCR